MKKGWLIYTNQKAQENKLFINWMIAEAKKQEIQLTLILRETLSIGIENGTFICHLYNKKVSLPDFAIVRVIEPLLNFHLEQIGIQPFNSSYVARICNDKALTHMEINKLNIPMVDTLFTLKEHLTDIPPRSYPFVVKETDGHGGQQVSFIHNLETFITCKNKLASNNIIIQSANVQLGKDVRVFIIGEKIIGAVLRESKTDFRANFKLGGSVTWYDLKPRDIKMVSTITHHFQFGMVGIDFLVGHHDELIFNEIEDVVGSRTLSKVSDKNIVAEYISFIKTYKK